MSAICSNHHGTNEKYNPKNETNRKHYKIFPSIEWKA